MFTLSLRASIACVCSALASCVAADTQIGSHLDPLELAHPLHGVYHWDAPRGPSNVDAFAAWSGRPIELASAYAPNSTWDELHDLGWQMPAWASWAREQPGRRIVYALPMLIEPGDTLAACAQGAYDVHFAAVGASLVDAGLTNAIVRIGWEWDGDWFAWSSRGHEREYAGCFQSAVRAMRNARPEGQLQFEWSASDDIFWRTPEQIAAAYPGDEYVDVFGVNAYDVSWVPNSYPLPGTCSDECKRTRRETAWNDMMRGVYLTRDLAAAHDKPIAIPEWGLWDRSDGNGGGDNADYVARMHAFVNEPSNRVLYQVYFDIDYVDGAHQISNLDGNQTLFPNAAAKYRELFGGD
ncbi:MAG TPA: glycosyl hydrolase [Polyangiales bacterium]|nr:glycosyl hydrolase [Polyangiales bacterium]